jgi:hypothetical protein
VKKGMANCFSEMIRDCCLDFISLQETMNKSYSFSFFRRSDPSGFFLQLIPSIGKSGGILCGMRQETFGVLGHKLGS